MVGFEDVVNALKCNAPFQISDQGQLSKLESVYGSPDSVDVWVSYFYLAFLLFLDWRIEEEEKVHSKFPLKRLVDLWRTQWRVAGSDQLWFAF